MFGEGKSAIVRAVAEQMGLPVIDIKMSSWDWRDEYYAAYRAYNGFDCEPIVPWTSNGWWVFEGDTFRKYRKSQFLKMTQNLQERVARNRDVDMIKLLVVDVEAL